MKRNILIFCVGWLPLPVGLLMDRFYSHIDTGGIVVSLIALFLWGVLAACISTQKKPAWLQSLIFCAPGILMFVLTLFQSQLMSSVYWLGYGAQTYFLPFLRLSAAILAFLMHSISATLCYFFTLVLLFAVSFVACAVKQKNGKTE